MRTLSIGTRTAVGRTGTRLTSRRCCTHVLTVRSVHIMPLACGVRDGSAARRLLTQAHGTAQETPCIGKPATCSSAGVGKMTQLLQRFELYTARTSRLLFPLSRTHVWQNMSAKKGWTSWMNSRRAQMLSAKSNRGPLR